MGGYVCTLVHIFLFCELFLTATLMVAARSAVLVVGCELNCFLKCLLVLFSCICTIFMVLCLLRWWPGTNDTCSLPFFQADSSDKKSVSVPAGVADESEHHPRQLELSLLLLYQSSPKIEGLLSYITRYR